MFQDPTAVQVSGGTGIVGWSVSGSSGPSSSPATALLASGPSAGQVDVASAPFLVGVNGSLSGTVTITPAVSGGTGTFAPTSQAITNGQQASFTFTPSSTGTLSVSFSNNGDLTNPGVLPYESSEGSPSAPDLSAWLVDSNPIRPWLADQGQIPAGVLLPTNKVGQENLVQGQYEKCGDPGVTTVEVETAATSATTIDANGGTWLSRVVDPQVGTRVAFKALINKTVANWTDPTHKVRAEMGSTGQARYEPWGQEQWCIGAIRLGAEWHNLEAKSGNEWAVLMQFHDAGGGLTANPPLAVEWSSGAGNPSASRLVLQIRQYDNPGWPADQTRGLNALRVQYPFATATDDWMYLIWHYCFGNGYTCPVDGEIYGPVGAARTAFVKFYAALGEAAAPELVYDYQGFWGSPFPSSMALADKLKSGYWKAGGIYSKTNFTAATGDNRIVHNLGFRQWRVPDLPVGVTAADVLAAFKASRVGSL